MISDRSMGALKFMIIAAIFVVAVLATAPTGFGQCAMCRASLAGSNNATFIRNLNIGVLVLLVPPVTIFCAIFVILKRRPNEGTSDDG
jgi:hypothetical protein